MNKLELRICNDWCEIWSSGSRVFSGTLADCYAYIKLSEQGYL